jgi:hypothetical protein
LVVRRGFSMATTTAIPTTKVSGGSFLLEERKPDEVFTPEDFTEQHHLIGQTAEEFAVNEIMPNAEKMEHKDFSVTRDLLKKAGDLGLSSSEIPEAYGGLEMESPNTPVSRLPGAGTPASARCPSFISAPKTRRRNICRVLARARLSALTLCRRLPPDRTRSTAAPRPNFRPTAGTTS